MSVWALSGRKAPYVGRPRLDTSPATH